VGSLTRPWTWWLAWGQCGLTLALLPPIVVLLVLNRNAPDIWSIAEPQTLLAVVAASLVGVTLATRRPGNVIGWLLLAMGLTGSIAGLLDLWGVYALVTRPDASGGAEALWLGVWFGMMGAPAPVLLLLLFPHGRFPDRRTRVVAVLTGLGSILLGLGVLTMHAFPVDAGFPDLYERAQNPWVPLEPIGPIEDPSIGIIAIAICGLLAVALLLGRFRSARGSERQQYKWVVLAMAFAVLFFVADFVARALGTRAYVVTSPGMSLSIALVPVAMGLAILRYRLWDIDVVISRTLLYLTLSASVVGIYVFIVGWLGTLFRTRDNPSAGSGQSLVISLVATGVVAVLFQPLRERVQRGVNRLLYGERDEPYAVISRLGRRLEESLAPDAVLPAIAGTVREALRLPYSAIALQQGDSQVIVAALGEPVPDPVRLPLVYRHEPVGELLLAPRAPGEAFSPADRRLLDDLARQAGVAVHAVQLTHELQQARERLVATREEERRRLRRDLHDGLGSQLAALNLQAGALRGLIERDPAAAQDEVVELRAQLRAAIASIRTLVHGLRPPAIDELGLLVALRERARQYSAEGLVVETDLPDTLPALPAAVEVAVYRIVEEALANVARHADARWCVVRLAAGDVVVLSIEDDGRGIDPFARAGVGLLSMRERAEEVGGSCAIGPRAGSGTRISVQLPWRSEQVDA
jgi:signal transduction histidine kinase